MELSVLDPKAGHLQWLPSLGSPAWAKLSHILESPLSNCDLLSLCALHLCLVPEWGNHHLLLFCRLLTLIAIILILHL